MGYTWTINIINFEHIGYSLLAIFTLSTVEGYPDYMGLNMDANDAEYVNSIIISFS